MKMGTIRMTVGQALVRFLDQQYVCMDGEETKFVEGIFTVFGHGIVCGLGQALDENPGGLKVFQGKNEQGMAHVAAAFAKQNDRKKIIACASSIGPGAANMVTAAACATVNNIPLLLLPGDAFGIYRVPCGAGEDGFTVDLGAAENIFPLARCSAAAKYFRYERRQ